MSRGAGIVVGLATALVIVGLSIVPFFSPPWMTVAQGRAGVAALTGWTEPQVRAATGGLVADLITGGDFEVVVNGETVLSPSERSHMRDVRGVFAGFALLVGAAAVVVAIAWRRSRLAAWRAIRGGAVGAAAGLVLAGVVLAVAFDAAFSLFHAIFFAAGSWTFDPLTDRLVQLFPDQFWFETTAAVGILAFVLAIVVALIAGRRVATLRRT